MTCKIMQQIIATQLFFYGMPPLFRHVINFSRGKMGEGQALCIAHLSSYYAQVDIPDTCYTCVEFVTIVNLSQSYFFPHRI